MNYLIREKDGFTIVSVEGQVCGATQDDFMVRLNDLCDAMACQTVLLDMGKVSYLNSAGLGMIIESFRKFRDKGGQLVLCGLNPDINRLFAATRLNRFIQIYPGVNEALHTLKRSADAAEGDAIMRQEVA